MAFKTGRCWKLEKGHYTAPSAELALEEGGTCHKTNYVMMRQKVYIKVNRSTAPTDHNVQYTLKQLKTEAVKGHTNAN
jgi:hypothetical protein